jgi:hypothetical protein
MQTISEAFAAWCAIEAQLPGTDEATFNRPAEEQARIEDVAVELPIFTALEVFQLLAMTVDEASQPNIAAEVLFRRAREEASSLALTAPTLSTIFERWLPLARKTQDGTATEAEIAEDLALVRLAAQMPITDALDVWRKLAMVFDITDPGHAGTEAQVMAEARAALGITEPARH